MTSYEAEMDMMENSGHWLTLIRHCYHIYLVVRDEAGLEANEDDGPLLVPGHVEPVQVGVRAQPPQLEVHLVGVLAGTHYGHLLLYGTTSK